MAKQGFSLGDLPGVKSFQKSFDPFKALLEGGKKVYDSIQGDESGGGQNKQLGFIQDPSYESYFGEGSDPSSQLFTAFDENNPLSTGVGKYATPYLSLLNSPEFQSLKEFNWQDTMYNTPEFEQMEKATDPGHFLALMEPGISQTFRSARSEGRGSLARGGLGGAAEAALDVRLAAGKAERIGQATGMAGELARKASSDLFSKRMGVEAAELSRLSNIQQQRQSVLRDILRPVLSDKGAPTQSTDWGAIAGGAGSAAGSFAALYSLGAI